MRRALTTILTALLPLGLAGCLELTQKTYLNPDGSGKALIETYTSMGPMAGMMGGKDGKGPDMKMMAKQGATRAIQQAKGVDAWSDVSYEVTPDNKIHFKGTAYFPDIKSFSMGGSQNELAWAKDDQGGMTLTMQQPKKADAGGEKPQLTDEEIAKKVADAKAKYQQSKPMMAMVLNSLKIDMSFVMPGSIAEANMFKKVDDNTAQLLMDGKKMGEAMDMVMADDKLLTESIKAGKAVDAQGNNEAVMEKVFGGKGPARIRVTGVKPLFDYKAEMGKAKAAMPDMLKKLELEPGAAPAGGGLPPL